MDCSGGGAASLTLAGVGECSVVVLINDLKVSRSVDTVDMLMNVWFVWLSGSSPPQ